MPSGIYKHKPHTEETKVKIRFGIRKSLRLLNTGENNHRWMGGITPLAKKIRGLAEYKEWRRKVFIRDDYTCHLCNVRGGKLNADHYPKAFSIMINELGIKTVEDAIRCDELWSLEVGRTLYKECHIGTDSYGGRIHKCHLEK